MFLVLQLQLPNYGQTTYKSRRADYAGTLEIR